MAVVTDDDPVSKVSGIYRVTRTSAEDPDLKELLYIGGILNNRIENYFNSGRAMQWLRAARSWGVPMHRLDSLARTVRNWTQFNEGIDELIDEFCEPQHETPNEDDESISCPNGPLCCGI